MPKIPDSQNIVTGDGRRTIPDTSEGYITEGLRSFAKSVGSVASAALKIETDKIDQARALQEKTRILDSSTKLSEFATTTYQKFLVRPDIADMSSEKVREEYSKVYDDEIKRLKSGYEFREGEEELFVTRLKMESAREVQLIGREHLKSIQQKTVMTLEQRQNKNAVGVMNSPGSLTDAILASEGDLEELAPAVGINAAQVAHDKAVGRFIKAAAEGYINQQQFGALFKLLSGIDPETMSEINIGAYLAPEEIDKYNDLAKDGARFVQAQNLSDLIITSGKSDTDQIKDILAIDDPDLKSEVMQNYRISKSLVEAAKSNQIKQDNEQVWSVILDAGDNAIPSMIPAGVKADVRRQMINWMSKDHGKAIKTDHALYLRLSDMAHNKPEEYAKLDVTQYFSFLSDSDRKDIIKWKTEGVTPKQSADKRTADQIGKSTYTEFMKVKPEVRPVKFTSFTRKFYSNIVDFEVRTGKEASVIDVQKIADTLLINGELNIEFIFRVSFLAPWGALNRSNPLLDTSLLAAGFFIMGLILMFICLNCRELRALMILDRMSRPLIILFCLSPNLTGILISLKKFSS